MSAAEAGVMARLGWQGAGLIAAAGCSSGAPQQQDPHSQRGEEALWLCMRFASCDISHPAIADLRLACTK